MPPKTKSPNSAATRKVQHPTYDVAGVIAALKRSSSKATRDGMARYGLPAEKAFGVPVGTMRQLAQRIGPNHELAAALWKTGWYEARMVAVFIEDPAQVTAAQLDDWCGDFEDWGICDTACFHLFDKLPNAPRKVELWSRRRGEFQKRGAFALLACLALHGRDLDEAWFERTLPLIERAAGDPRNFVKTAVSWALRSIGERSRVLNAAALVLSKRLAESDDATERWVGKDALRKLK